MIMVKKDPLVGSFTYLTVVFLFMFESGLMVTSSNEFEICVPGCQRFWRDGHQVSV